MKKGKSSLFQVLRQLSINADILMDSKSSSECFINHNAEPIENDDNGAKPLQ